MHRILVIVFMLMSITTSAFAVKQEWIDKTYDFSSVDSVVVRFNIPENVKNGIVEHETTEIFYDYFQKRLVDKLSKKNVEVLRYEDVLGKFADTQGADASVLKHTGTKDVESELEKYIQENFDLVCNIDLEKYITTTQYQPGYSVVETIPVKNNVVDSDGMFRTVTTYKTKTNYVEGGNFPIAFMIIRFELVDLKSDKNIWLRIDDKAEASKVSQFFHTSPEAKDLYKGSLKDYFSDVSSRLIKAKKKFSKKVD